MLAYEPYLSIAVALGVGLLIGLEREQAIPSEESPQSTLAGVRTHPLFSLAGAISMLMAGEVGDWFVGVVLVGVFGLVGVSYWDEVKRSGDRGLTSEAALILAFLLGAMTRATTTLGPGPERLVLVAAIGVAVTTLLSLKAALHHFVKRLSRQDVFASIKFLIAAVIVLPLLPNETYGPLDALNPFHIGMMIVLIAGLEFVGYVAVRVLGPGRGLGLTGLVGGLVSSTAVTLSMAARAKADKSVVGACALAVVLASTVMFVRVVLEVLVVYPPLVSAVVFPMGAMTLAGVGAAGFLYRNSRKTTATSDELDVKNPFELGSAIKFGLLFGVVLLASKAANTHLGEQGTYLAGVLAGTTDVDAITLSMANLAKEGLSHEVAATTILLATASNTLVKGAMAASLGGPRFGRTVAIALAATLLAGAAGVAVLWTA